MANENQKRVIDQFVHTLSYGDAISTEVIALQKVLQDKGYLSRIFAINCHPKYKGKTIPYEQYMEDRSDQEIIFHYSLGSPLNKVFLNLNKTRRITVYHNITPARWFYGVNQRVAKDIEEGIAELGEICKVSDLIISDSTFNAQEVIELGYNSIVLPLPVSDLRWSEPPNPGMASLLKSDPGIHLLHVGRLAPNKAIEDILKIFYFLHHHLQVKSRLWLVGGDVDTELYSFSLKRMAVELRIDHAVNFSGQLADNEIRALYEGCSAYLCMSEHEGFCLPVVEAMRFGLPVISYERCALAETVAGGGILVSEKNHLQIAELVAFLSESENLQYRRKLVDAGKDRYQQFSTERFEERVSEIFEL